MPHRPPFDPIRASFYLIAFVIVVHCIVILAGAAMCIVHAAELIAGRFECDKHGKLAELLAAALGTALAFVGMFINRSK